MSMIAAALPLVGGVLDGKTRGVFAKQFRESSKHDKSDCQLRHDIRPACSLHSHPPVRRGVKSWAQSRIHSVRDKIDNVRLHREKADLACDVDSRLTRLCSGDAL